MHFFFVCGPGCGETVQRIIFVRGEIDAAFDHFFGEIAVFFVAFHVFVIDFKRKIKATDGNLVVEAVAVFFIFLNIFFGEEYLAGVELFEILVKQFAGDLVIKNLLAVVFLADDRGGKTGDSFQFPVTLQFLGRSDADCPDEAGDK